MSEKTKFDLVWEDFPDHLKTNITEKLIRITVDQHSYLPDNVLQVAMLSVLEKFGNNRSDLATLFARNVGWAAEEWLSDNPDVSLTYEQWKKWEQETRNYNKEELEAQVRRLENYLGIHMPPSDDQKLEFS